MAFFLKFLYGLRSIYVLFTKVFATVLSDLAVDGYS